MNVLIVDDELNIRKTLLIFFESEGHHAVAVSNADDALAETGQVSFDLALVDLRLGATSGLDLIPELLASSPWLKIVVITAYASIDTAVEAIKRGAVDYLPKPFTPAQLQIVISKVMQVRSLEEKIRSLQETLRLERRERDRQESAGKVDSSAESAQRQTVRGHLVPVPFRRAARERTLWPPQRRLHRRGARSARARGDLRRRHASAG
jgi:NtrC-family two-component system response regulator AlgB